MKKNILVLTALLGILVFSMGGVLAVDANQPVQVTIGTDVTVAITPNPLDFGSVPAGSVNFTGPDVHFNATGSNVNVTVAVTNVTGVPFATGLKFNSITPIGQIAFLPCTVVADVCTYTPVDWTTSLSIPIGTPAGLKSGTITYDVAGPSP